MPRVIIGIISMITGCCRKSLSSACASRMLTQSRTTVTPEMSAQEKKWWLDERYAIYDLNVNSVAAFPEHEEELNLATAGSTYTAKGYAYAGGGRRITRVEISLDKGKCTTFSSFPLQAMTC